MDYRISSSRRRPSSSSYFHESCRLDAANRCSSSVNSTDYSTFLPANSEVVDPSASFTRFPHLCLLLASSSDRSTTSIRWVSPAACKEESKRSDRRRSFLLKTITGISFCWLFGLTTNLGRSLWQVQELQWRWDHNAYDPRRAAATVIHPPGDPTTFQQTVVAVPASSSSSEDFDSRSKTRNLLLLQTAGSATLEKLVEVSGRPNRAYARQWGRDYVEVFRPSSSLLSRTCFDKAIAFQTIMEKQNNHILSFQHVPYDVLALLPTDAIVLDLDYDLLHLMPDDKLVSISGWHRRDSLDNTLSSGAEILFFNLRHRYAAAVSQLWWDMVRPRDVTCGAGNDLEFLLQAIESVIEPGEDVASLIVGLNETDRGFVGLDVRAIKSIPPTAPSSKDVMLLSNVVETRATLQTTADAVCYRYYPKCEVL